MSYRKREFDPPTMVVPDVAGGFPEDADVYVFDDPEIVLAVNVALATGRPLLVYGPAGSGKSSLGPNVARILGYEWSVTVVSARTEPEDLLWRYDALRRLNDAQARKLNPDDSHYYSHGLLWKAFAASGEGSGFVAVVDEIDKADPDIPSSLLQPLGSLTFDTPWGVRVAADGAHPPLIVITTNDERQLSKPFRRRCVAIQLRPPGLDHLLRVAQSHLGQRYDVTLATAVARELATVGDPEDRPSTAEFLDTVKACVALGIAPGSEEWKRLIAVSLLKVRGYGQ